MMLRSYCYIFFIFSACNTNTLTNIDPCKGHIYYFSLRGDDKNDGSMEYPLKTIEHLNSINLNPDLIKMGATDHGIKSIGRMDRRIGCNHAEKNPMTLKADVYAVSY